jgi:hypothetical protein
VNDWWFWILILRDDHLMEYVQQCENLSFSQNYILFLFWCNNFDLHCWWLKWSRLRDFRKYCFISSTSCINNFEMIYHESNFVMYHCLFLDNLSVLMNKQLFISSDFVQKIEISDWVWVIFIKLKNVQHLSEQMLHWTQKHSINALNWLRYV